jgi:hypothetical protein
MHFSASMSAYGEENDSSLMGSSILMDHSYCGQPQQLSSTACSITENKNSTSSPVRSSQESNLIDYCLSPIVHIAKVRINSTSLTQAETQSHIRTREITVALLYSFRI